MDIILIIIIGAIVMYFVDWLVRRYIV